MKTCRYIIIVISLFVFNISNLDAQVFPGDTILIDEVIVTATKTEHRLEDIPGKADIITSKQIKHFSAQKLDDLLRFTSGVNVNRSTGIYTMRPTVTLRGISGDEQGRTLVLLDGIPLNTSDEGGVNWNRIQASNIQKVEIFKGPGSSLYGNNAMGGVINIISKKPIKPIEGLVGMSYGTYNTYKPELYIGGRLDNGLTYSLSGFYLESDGYINIPDSDRTQYTVKRFLKEGAASANVGYRFNDHLNVDLRYDFYKDKRGEGEKINAPDGEYRHFTTNSVRAHLFGESGKFKYDANLFFQREHYFRIDERIKGDNYSRFDVESDRDDYGAILNTSYPIGLYQNLTIGTELRNGRVDGGDYYQTSEDKVLNKGALQSTAIYIQDEIKLLDEQMQLVAGLRLDNARFYDGDYQVSGTGVDYWQNYSPESLEDHQWTAISPRIAFRWHIIEQISLYGSYSKGFRASILDDLCRSGWMWVGPKIANPELEPEYLHNIEGGLNIKLLDNLTIEPTVFYSLGTDFLYYVATGDSLFNRPVYRRENVTEVNIMGAEVDLRYQIGKQITLRANYAYNESEIGSFEQRPDIVGKTLKYTPKHRASASVLWTNLYLNTGLTLLYKDEQYTDDANTQSIGSYYTIDCQFSHSFFGETMDAALMIQDLLDNEHMENVLYLSPGRLITAKLTVRF